MIDIPKGSYWDLPWSLVSGCTPCSPGCDHCWSLAMERRFHRGPEVQGNGVHLHPDRLSVPLKRRKPTVYAVWNDLFHEAVPDKFIADTIGHINGYPKHTFLILTKRPDRMRDFMLKCGPWEGWVTHNGHPPACYGGDGLIVGQEKETMTRENRYEVRKSYWPPWNLYFGLTVCNQAEADAKIPVFLQVPGKKFLSIEPMLGAINLTGGYYGPNWLEGWDVVPEHDPRCDGSCYAGCPVPVQVQTEKIDAVILGGETGPGARPMHPDWVRSVRDQCAAAGVPFFFKGWGEWRHESQYGQHIPSLRLLAIRARHHEFSDGSWAYKVKNEVAGRLLDGRTHDELPWIEAREG